MMESKDWFGKNKEILKKNIAYNMDNTFGESAAKTSGRPSSTTYSLVYSEGLKTLQVGILILISDRFKIYPTTENKIEIIRKEFFGIYNECVEFIFNKYTNKYGIGKNQNKNKINEIEMDINKAIENQKQVMKESQKKIWKENFTIFLSVAAILISIFKP